MTTTTTPAPRYSQQNVRTLLRAAKRNPAGPVGDEALGAYLNVTRQRFSAWRQRYPDLDAAVWRIRTDRMLHAARTEKKCGFTNEDLGRILGVSHREVSRWRKACAEFETVCQEIKDLKDDQVECSLFERAVGYEYDEVKEVVVDGVVTRRETTRKKVAPDTTAQIFWLKNRRPDLWRDVQDRRHSGEIGIADVTIYVPDNDRNKPDSEDDGGGTA